MRALLSPVVYGCLLPGLYAVFFYLFTYFFIFWKGANPGFIFHCICAAASFVLLYSPLFSSPPRQLGCSWDSARAFRSLLFCALWSLSSSGKTSAPCVFQQRLSSLDLAFLWFLTPHHHTTGSFTPHPMCWFIGGGSWNMLTKHQVSL